MNDGQREWVSKFNQGVGSRTTPEKLAALQIMEADRIAGALEKLAAGVHATRPRYLIQVAVDPLLTHEEAEELETHIGEELARDSDHIIVRTLGESVVRVTNMNAPIMHSDLDLPLRSLTQLDEEAINRRPSPPALKPEPLTASEALFAFAGWLTTRDEVTTMGATEDAAPIATLIQEFCQRHGLTEPREGWESGIVPATEGSETT